MAYNAPAAKQTNNTPVRALYLLALLPFIGILGGAFFANRIEPFVLGLPFFLFWSLAWIVLTSIIMAIIYLLDPSNRAGAD